MNRENKRKQFQNGYYKNHRCDDTFTCKHCGRVVVPIGAGTQHRNHCPNCLVSLHLGRHAPCRRGVEDAAPLPCFLRNFPFTNSDNVVY